MHDYFFWIAGAPPPVGASISADALLPLGALAIGVAIGVVNIYTLARDKAYAYQYDAVARRLKECEQYRDGERAERDGYREEVADAHIRNAELEARLAAAHTRIAELEARYERRRPDADPESRKP